LAHHYAVYFPLLSKTTRIGSPLCRLFSTPFKNNAYWLTIMPFIFHSFQKQRVLAQHYAVYFLLLSKTHQSGHVLKHTSMCNALHTGQSTAAQHSHTVYAISRFRRQSDENCALLVCYSASGANSLSTLRDNLLAPFSNESWPFNPLALKLNIYSLAHHLCKMWIFYEPRSVTLGNTRHFVEE